LLKITRVVRRIVLAAAVAGVVIPPHPAVSAEGGGNGIAFLTISLSDDNVRLVDWTIAEGVLHPPRAGTRHGDLEYEAVTASDSIVWTGSLPDPLTRRVEYEDPDNPGQLKMKTVTLDSARFVVRVPVDSRIDRFVFYRAVKPSEKAVAARKPLGAIISPWREVKK
jgi:hypothetical protein